MKVGHFRCYLQQRAIASGGEMVCSNDIGPLVFECSFDGQLHLIETLLP